MADRLVTIASFEHLTDAHAAKNALQAAGIEASLDNEQTSSLFGAVLPTIGLRLVVREEDEPQAVAVLDATFGSEGEKLSEEDLAAQAEAEVAEDPVDAEQQPALPVVDPVADPVARERDARFALLAVCLGFCIPVGHLFAIVMIMQACSGPGKLSRRGRLHVYAAILILAFIYMPLVILLIQLRDS